MDSKGFDSLKNENEVSRALVLCEYLNELEINLLQNDNTFNHSQVRLLAIRVSVSGFKLQDTESDQHLINAFARKLKGHGIRPIDRIEIHEESNSFIVYFIDKTIPLF